ncbi:hypothetical protein GGTG_07659 [Gaeumannomyces tritici R3-111a-1]|uniref:Protein kinase domain-containing protein n=1 Tax=Gaeumannomyces tritici (strain R3-111a-1) TaxID=644352 RepID=J3P2B1_GAET3|nr:hypothetical protein GGTG_07659 [Gaeumannomyces tritici R3-111a-1]EJT73803.1 hypothetical protein GGTG_07659 [Gaeumannomyces tritici R3-111a-1]
MTGPLVVVVHFGNPRQYFQVLAKVGEGRFHVALRVAPLRNALGHRIGEGDFVLKFAKQETGQADSPLRVEARNVPVFQTAQLDSPYECPNIARLMFDFTGSRNVGNLLAHGDLSSTLWNFYSVGTLGSLCLALRESDAPFPAYFGARLLSQMLEAVYAMHMEHREFAITHRDECSANVFIDYPMRGDPGFLLGDFCEGQILRASSGTKPRYDALRDSITRVCRGSIFEVPHSNSQRSERQYWQQIRVHLDRVVSAAARAPTRPGMRGWNDMGRALSDAIVALQHLAQAIVFAEGGDALFADFREVARDLADRNSRPSLTADNYADAVHLAESTFKLRTGWKIAGTLPGNPHEADLNNLMDPPRRE